MRRFLERLYAMRAKRYERLTLKAMKKLENTSAEDKVMNTYWLNRFMEYSDKKRKYELLLG